MRILLAHNSLYAGSFGGGDKSNRLLMEALAARGHQVRVVSRLERFTEDEARKVVPLGPIDPVLRTSLNGVDVHTLLLDPRVRLYFSSQIDDFDPDVILTSTDDPAQLLLDAALHSPRARVVHLVRATIAVPFGPDSSSRSSTRADLLRRVDAIVGVSEYVARYVREYGGMPAVHVPISLMEPGDWPAVGRFDNRFISLVNPCAVKGIDIFLDLADRMPSLEFAAVPTWGTNSADLDRLALRGNITVLPPVPNILDLLSQTRVMLVPSLWAEARSRIVVEAMLGGVPVVASDIGGIPEAKLGVPYLIPVKPITGYKHSVDEHMVPVAEVPPQDLGPWEAALHRLTTGSDHWCDVAARSRAAAAQYASNLSVQPFEELLLDVVRRPKASTAPSSLSSEKQRLLAVRLKHKSWFPTIGAPQPGQIRLFCFPHAGAGTRTYRSWTASLQPSIGVCPVLLPGRESRAAEPPLRSMTELIAELLPAIRPHLNTPFIFFGHSMGAGIAFELARALRRGGLPQPQALFVSAARAPQFRLNYTPGPEPSDDELIQQLERLDSLPSTPDALRVALPLLRADTTLYRNYVYTPEPPLDIPIAAYSGAADPNQSAGHMDAWREQTTASFTRREFPGGHFYLQSDPGFLDLLRADLQALTTVSS